MQSCLNYAMCYNSMQDSFKYRIDILPEKWHLNGRIKWCTDTLGEENKMWKIGGSPTNSIFMCSYLFLHEEDAIMFKMIYG